MLHTINPIDFYYTSFRSTFTFLDKRDDDRDKLLNLWTKKNY